MKVLVGVDGSAGSYEAVRLVGELLSAKLDELLLFYAPPHLGIVEGKPPEADILERVERTLSEAVFERALDCLPPALAKKAQTLTGDPQAAQGLLTTAADQKVDLLAVGARGAGPIDSVTLGSVANAVVHHANIPVLVARPRPAERLGEPWRVALLCDDTPASKLACETLGHFSFPAESVGYALTVMESPVVGHVPEWLEEQAHQRDADAMAQAWARRHDAEKEAVRERLRCYCQSHSPIFAAGEPVVVEGHPAHELLKLVPERRIDLVALGDRPAGFFSRMLLGSTADQVLTHSHASVLIVREEA